MAQETVTATLVIATSYQQTLAFTDITPSTDYNAVYYAI
jgi:hypothetical protein